MYVAMTPRRNNLEADNAALYMHLGACKGNASEYFQLSMANDDPSLKESIRLHGHDLDEHSGILTLHLVGYRTTPLGWLTSSLAKLARCGPVVSFIPSTPQDVFRLYAVKENITSLTWLVGHESFSSDEYREIHASYAVCPPQLTEWQHSALKTKLKMRGLEITNEVPTTTQRLLTKSHETAIICQKRVDAVWVVNVLRKLKIEKKTTEIFCLWGDKQIPTIYYELKRYPQGPLLTASLMRKKSNAIKSTNVDYMLALYAASFPR